MNHNELVKAMTDNGVNRPVALVLVELKSVGPENSLTVLELMERTKLRQPEISYATVKAYHAGWVKAIPCKERPRGRPFYRYSLAQPFNDIIADIMKRRYQAIDEMIDSINILQAVAN
jgi:predicted transcriptional regulator